MNVLVERRPLDLVAPFGDDVVSRADCQSVITCGARPVVVLETAKASLVWYGVANLGGK